MSVEANTSYNQLYRYIFLPWAQIATEFRRDALPSEHGKLLELERQWQHRTNQMALVRQEGILAAETSQEEALPNDQLAQLETLQADPTFKRMFHGAQIRLALVGIDNLIAPQCSLNLDHVDRLQTAFKEHLEVPDLIQICLSSRQENEAPFEWVLTDEGPTGVRYELRSPNPNLRNLDVVQVGLTDEEIEDFALLTYPATAMMVIAGFGSNPIRVDRIGERRILANGFHRVYALRSLGVTAIPAVVRNIRNIEEDCAPVMHGWQTRELFAGPRPPLFKDFFSSFTMRFRARHSMGAWELIWRRKL